MNLNQVGAMQPLLIRSGSRCKMAANWPRHRCVGPRGMPPEIVETLNREIGAIITTAEFHQRMAAIGVDVLGTSAAEYTKLLNDDYAKWARVVKAAGITPE